MKERDPFRYYMEIRPITFLESIRRLWQTWKWNRDEMFMRPVKKGEAGYEEAPFEESIIWHRNTMKINYDKTTRKSRTY